MADYALIPCEVCNNLFTLQEYMTHAATHQAPMAPYNTGNMYGPTDGGMGPMNKPANYVDPHPNAVVTCDDYTTLADGTKYYYNNGDMYGGKSAMGTDSKTDDSKTEMNDEKKNEIQDISTNNANSIRDNGCAVIKNGIRKDLIKNALRLINNALSNGPQCLTKDEYTQNNDILDLFNESAAFSLCQNVLGLVNVIIPKKAEIRLCFPNKTEMDSKEMESMDLKWDINGLGNGVLAEYSLGMTMVLSKQKFRYYKGTHMQVFEALKKEGIEKFIAANKEENERKEWAKQNSLEELEVDIGDIVLYHPFLCLPLVQCNNTENIEYCVDFKVNHKKFNKEVAMKRAQHLWLGYEKLTNALIDEVLSI